jgi:hypothetical protein
MRTTPMPNDTRDADSGRFAEKRTDGEFVSAVRALDMPATNEVAEYVDCPYRTAYGRLTRLESTGRLTSRNIGNSLVWFVADEEADS